MVKVKIDGFIKKVKDEERVNANLKKQIIFVETHGNKPQQYEIAFWNQKTDLLKGYGAGNGVVVEGFLNGKYFEKPDGKEGTYLSIVAETIQKV